MYGKMQASGLTEFIPFLCTSAYPVFLLMHSPRTSALTVQVGSIFWITVLGALIHIWRPEITDGCDISC